MAFRRFVLFTVVSVFIAAGTVKPQFSMHKLISASPSATVIEIDFSGQYSLRDTVIGNTRFQVIDGNSFSFRKVGEPWLPSYYFSLAVPHSSSPQVTVLEERTETLRDKNILPYPDNDSYFGEFDLSKVDQNVYGKADFFPAAVVQPLESYIMRFVKVLPVAVSPYRFNPVTRELRFTRFIRLRISHPELAAPGLSFIKQESDPLSREFIQTSVVNPDQAVKFLAYAKSNSDKPLPPYWYNPNKNYFKIYVTRQGLYRVSFNELVNAGAPLGAGVRSSKLELFNNGVPVPIEIVDRGDSVFDQLDYFRFIGYPPAASRYCQQNIYTKNNVYWFSYQSDSSGLRYKYVNGTPRTFDNTLLGTQRTDFYEKDSLFERLGYAPDDRRDYWFWDKATGTNGTPQYKFQARFNAFRNFNFNFPVVRVRVNMHGMTDFSCQYGHIAKISINGKFIGDASWNGQDAYTFDKNVIASSDSVPIYPEGNILQVSVDGNICHPSKTDEIRVNWFDFTYYSENRVVGDYFTFKYATTNNQAIRFWMWQWQADTMSVFVPGRAKIINNVFKAGDADKTFIFVDTVNGPTDYIATSEQAFFVVDSIVKDQVANLRAVANGADYIIITHNKFTSIAERLKALRLRQFTDSAFTAPRIAIVDIQDIYDEFSYGMADPYAPQWFVQYAFENWAGRKPSYITLLGDMSFDLRKINSASRDNYIPSYPYHSYTYGQAASDNSYVAVVGPDIVPDLAIGRVSIENLEQGNVLLSKLENYPADPGKKWRENVLMLASGLNNTDENRFQFNDASLELTHRYITPYGYNFSGVFRYPNKPDHLPFAGSTEQIRDEINKGAVIANYYGHGGGYQWDATFTNEDIYLLRNENRLPFVISVTCYTAHFDNQEVFGEQFNRVPGKGSIAFFGSSGLTHWEIGKFINSLFFTETMGNKRYVVGKAVLFAKAQTPPVGLYLNQIALLTLLGDPALELALPKLPDLSVKANDISIFPENPVLGDSLQITLRMANYGIYRDDSISVQFKFSTADTSGTIVTLRYPLFGNNDSVKVWWKPPVGGLYDITASVNLLNSIPEADYTDNTAVFQVPVYNVSEPSILVPRNGYRTSSSKLNILFADIGYYLNRGFSYQIEIDTSTAFAAPLFRSSSILPQGGFVNWSSPDFNTGYYYWRSRIYDGTNYGNWSKIRSVALGMDNRSGYSLTGPQLKSANNTNMVFSPASQALLLNTNFLDPKPQQQRLIDDLNLDSATFYNKYGMSAMATDGKYLYIGNLSYWMANLYGDSLGRSRLYIVGTGFDGTVKGRLYGTVPGFNHTIRDQFTYHSDGLLYVPFGNPYKLLRVNPVSGFTDTVTVPAGLVEKNSGTVKQGSYHIASDSQYVYNIAFLDSTGNNRYTLRIFDPSDNWRLVNEYRYPYIFSMTTFVNFFVYRGIVYTYENYYGGLMRSFVAATGFINPEWLPYNIDDPDHTIRYYAWAYDWKNNVIYGSAYRPGVSQLPQVSVFVGRYIEANGKFSTHEIGPASRWSKVSYEITNNSPRGFFSTVLQGYNRFSRRWDSLLVNIPSGYDISGYSADTISAMKLSIGMIDSSNNSSAGLGIKSVNLEYVELPELVITGNDVSFSPDSLMQGFNTVMTAKVKNIGKADAQNITAKCFLNAADTAFFTTSFSLRQDSTFTFSTPINTSRLIFSQDVKVVLTYTKQQLFTFNDIITKSFFVIRDSTNPSFAVTFDGRQIINGDIVSKNPEISISLKDNSPLPLDTSYFTIILDNVPLSVANSGLQWSYTPYPNSEARVTWKPLLKKGRHTLDVLAKDASGNFFDTTYNRSIFNVYEEDDIANIYNYPNPFRDGTFFTFELRGNKKPDEIKIRIFTIAGRLIKEIVPPTTDYFINFNKIFWDGRDADGNEIANGVYLYKVITRFQEKTKTGVYKLVKMR